MNILGTFKDYINDNKHTITILNDYIYISNYEDIKSFDSNKFTIKVKEK